MKIGYHRSLLKFCKAGGDMRSTNISGASLIGLGGDMPWNSTSGKYYMTLPIEVATSLLLPPATAFSRPSLLPEKNGGLPFCCMLDTYAFCRPIAWLPLLYMSCLSGLAPSAFSNHCLPDYNFPPLSILLQSPWARLLPSLPPTPDGKVSYWCFLEVWSYNPKRHLATLSFNYLHNDIATPLVPSPTPD